MQPTGRARQGLTYDATNIEECRQVASLLGTEVSCGKHIYVVRHEGSGQTSWSVTARKIRSPDPGPLPPFLEEVVRAHGKGLVRVTGEFASPEALSGPESCRMALISLTSPPWRAPGSGP